MLWWIFAANAAVFVLAVALLAWTPITVHRVATPRELAILGAGLIVMLAVDLWLLRRILAPLQRLAATMGAVDPVHPGRRATAPMTASREVHTLARALNAMLDRMEGERRDSGRRVLAAQEQERTRIARELHDEVGQMLTAIALRAERAAAQTDGQSQALTEIADTALRSLDDVRRLGRELRPEALDDLGLVRALISLCTRVDRQGGVRVRRNLRWDVSPLSPEVELVIYRIAQEALTNVLRHADAREVVVTLEPREGELMLLVRDDGRGLPEPVGGRGLRGMRERAMLIDAELTVTRRIPHGTDVRLSVPV